MILKFKFDMSLAEDVGDKLQSGERWQVTKMDLWIHSDHSNLSKCQNIKTRNSGSHHKSLSSLEYSKLFDYNFYSLKSRVRYQIYDCENCPSLRYPVVSLEEQWIDIKPILNQFYSTANILSMTGSKSSTQSDGRFWHFVFGYFENSPWNVRRLIWNPFWFWLILMVVR